MAEMKSAHLVRIPTETLQRMYDDIVVRIGRQQTAIGLAREEIANLDGQLSVISEALIVRRHFGAKAPAAPAGRKGRKR